MKEWCVHTLPGSVCCSSDGLEQILKIFQCGKESSNLITVSPRESLKAELVGLIEAAITREERLWAKMEVIHQKQNTLAEELIPPSRRGEVETSIRQDFKNIEDILRAVWLVRECSPMTREYIAGLDVTWAAGFLLARFRSAGFEPRFIDSGKCITVFHGPSGLEVDWEASSEKIGEIMKASGPGDEKKSSGGIPIFLVEGGAAQTAEGSVVSLGKDGGEFTSSIMAYLLHARSITHWVEVRGVMSADPGKVPGAEVIPELTYQEATELAFFGAEILHPPTMIPAILKGIPIRIRSIREQDHPGTTISNAASSPGTKPVKGFSIIDRVALLNVEGDGMIGVPGISSRLFSALQKKKISVILISQASSEHSICCAVPEQQSEEAARTAREAFAPEIASHRINAIDIEPDCSILAAVGDQMSGIPGISAKFFGALGKAGVNVRAIAQGSSERNISAVIHGDDSTRALRAVHAGFYLSNQSLSIGVIGPGLIGSTFLDQLADGSHRLNKDAGVDLRVRGITDSKMMLLDESGIDLSRWQELFSKNCVRLEMDRFIRHVNGDYFPHSVIVDCTTSTVIPSHYSDWIEQGIHIITPNKKAGTAPLPEFHRLMNAARRKQRHFLYETTVGAGLPIIGTLRDLIQTGDRIIRIEGVFSGTLAYLFWRYDGTVPFSSLVQEAKDLGYTEPDPRDDLSGMDIVRKTVILAREVGFPVEVEDVPVRGLVPEELRNLPVEQFMTDYPVIDKQMLELFQGADKKGCVLKYAGIVEEDGSCRVELKEYPKDHAFARIKGSDNIVAFTTARYFEQPLVVQGPGAGPDVTAGGVFADLLRLASYLGAKI